MFTQINKNKFFWRDEKKTKGNSVRRKTKKITKTTKKSQKNTQQKPIKSQQGGKHPTPFRLNSLRKKLVTLTDQLACGYCFTKFFIRRRISLVDFLNLFLFVYLFVFFVCLFTLCVVCVFFFVRFSPKPIDNKTVASPFPIFAPLRRLQQQRIK